MLRRTKQITNIGALTAALSVLTACGPSLKEWAPSTEEPEVYSVAFRQAAPQPVYNRLKFVHLPEVLPSENLPDSNGGLILPLLHVKMSNSSLEKIAKVLASAHKYSYYCASSIAHRKITLNALGDISQLAKLIEEKAKVSVQIDHQLGALRIFPEEFSHNIGEETDSGLKPQFPSSKVVLDKSLGSKDSGSEYSPGGVEVNNLYEYKSDH